MQQEIHSSAHHSLSTIFKHEFSSADDGFPLILAVGSRDRRFFHPSYEGFHLVSMDSQAQTFEGFIKFLHSQIFDDPEPRIWRQLEKLKQLERSKENRCCLLFEGVERLSESLLHRLFHLMKGCSWISGAVVVTPVGEIALRAFGKETLFGCRLRTVYLEGSSKPLKGFLLLMDRVLGSADLGMLLSGSVLRQLRSDFSQNHRSLEKTYRWLRFLLLQQFYGCPLALLDAGSAAGSRALSSRLEAWIPNSSLAEAARDREKIFTCLQQIKEFSQALVSSIPVAENFGWFDFVVALSDANYEASFCRGEFFKALASAICSSSPSQAKSLLKSLGLLVFSSKEFKRQLGEVEKGLAHFDSGRIRETVQLRQVKQDLLVAIEAFLSSAVLFAAESPFLPFLRINQSEGMKALGHPNVSAGITDALRNPNQYLTGDHHAARLFSLYEEAGSRINVFDWFTAFQSQLLPDEDQRARRETHLAL